MPYEPPCRAGNAGHPGTKEPKLQILSLHDCMTAACSLHSADLTAHRQCPGWWRQAHCYAHVGGGLAPGARGIVSWRRACGGHQLTVCGAGETTPAQQQSPTPERSDCYTAVLLWFLMLSEWRSSRHNWYHCIRMTRMTFIPSLFMNLNFFIPESQLNIWRRAVQSIKQSGAKN